MIYGLFHLSFIGPGGSELLFVMLVLLVLFGAKDAPRMFRKMNDFLSQLRSTAEHFKREIMYSDMAGEPETRRSEGDYNDYGQAPDGPVEDSSDELLEDRSGEQEPSAGEEQDAGAPAGEGEDDDARKA